MLMAGQRDWTEVRFGNGTVGYRAHGRYGLRVDVIRQEGAWYVEVVSGKDSTTYERIQGSLEDARVAGERLLKKVEGQHKKLLFRLGDEVEIVKHQTGTHFRPGVRAKVVDIVFRRGEPPGYSIQHAEGFRLWVDGADIRKVGR